MSRFMRSSFRVALPLTTAATLLAVASCQDVSVTTVAVDRIEVEPATAQVQVNGTLRLTARVMSQSGQELSGRTIAWTSLNPGVADVDGSGNVSANAAGTAVIRASSEGATADATVTVTAAPAIGLGTSSVSFSATAGGANPSPQTVQVTNAGTGTLSGLSTSITYAGGSSGWLSATLSGTTAPASLTLSATTGSRGAGTYQATVRVSSSQASNSPQQIQVTFTVTSAAPPAPSAPSTLVAAAVSTSRIDLVWTPSTTGSVQQYRIQRRVVSGSGSGSFALIDSVGGGSLTYQNTGLQAGTQYAYRVQACSASACSGWSPEASATTLSEGSSVPGVPGDVTATRTSPSQIQVGWTAPGGQLRYEIRRRTGTGGQWTFDATAPGDATGYVDSPVNPNTTYQYQVRACAAGGCSQYSSPVTVAPHGGD